MNMLSESQRTSCKDLLSKVKFLSDSATMLEPMPLLAQSRHPSNFRFSCLHYHCEGIASEGSLSCCDSAALLE